MQDLSRRVRALESRASQTSTWDFSALNDDQLNELAELHPALIVQTADQHKRFEQLTRLVVRKGLSPVADLSDEEIDARLAAHARAPRSAGR